MNKRRRIFGHLWTLVLVIVTVGIFCLFFLTGCGQIQLRPVSGTVSQSRQVGSKTKFELNGRKQVYRVSGAKGQSVPVKPGDRVKFKVKATHVLPSQRGRAIGFTDEGAEG